MVITTLRLGNSLGQSTDNTRNQPSKRRQESPEGELEPTTPKKAKHYILRLSLYIGKKLTLATNIQQIKKNRTTNFQSRPTSIVKHLPIDTVQRQLVQDYQ